MACHIMDVAFWALALGAPTYVECVMERGNNEQTFPGESVIRYQFPQRRYRRRKWPEVSYTWCDGGIVPPVAKQMRLIERNEAVFHYQMGQAQAVQVMANVPFRFLFFGDLDSKAYVTSEELADVNTIVVPTTTQLTPAENSLLRSEWKKPGKRCLQGKPADVLPALRDDCITVEDAASVCVTVRRGRAASAPLICHLLNRDYDSKQDAYIPARDFTVHLPSSVLRHLQADSARLVASDTPPGEIGSERRPDGLLLSVPKHNEWAVVVIRGTYSPGP